MGWLFLLGLGPVALVFGLFGLELFGDGIRAIPVLSLRREKVERETRSVRFSWRRIAYVFGEAVVILGLMLALALLIRWVAPAPLAAVVSFFRHNFH